MPSPTGMQIYDTQGHRLYLTGSERAAFRTAAEAAPREVRTYCWTLLYTGCRPSEALALTADRVDFQAAVLTFESKKKRRLGLYRAVRRGSSVARNSSALLPLTTASLKSRMCLRQDLWCHPADRPTDCQAVSSSSILAHEMLQISSCASMADRGTAR